jgi:hypothetical protein
MFAQVRIAPPPAFVRCAAVDLAKHIVETKSADFEPEKFEDRYENVLVELLNQKRKGETPGPTAQGRIAFAFCKSLFSSGPCRLRSLPH